MRMYYTGVVFKSVRDSDWSAGHVWAVPGRDGTTLVYGRTYAGRYLLAVVIAEAEEAFVVTARDMTDGEKKTFRRKAR